MFSVEPVLALLMLVVAGYIVHKIGLVNQQGLIAMTNLVLYVAIPSIAITNLQREPTAELVRGLIATFGLSALFMLITGGIGYLLSFRERERQRMLITHLCMFSNCGFMGFPIIAALFGESYMIYAVIINAAFNLLAWTVGVLLLQKDRDKEAGAGVFSKREDSLRLEKSRPPIWKILLSPTLIGIAAGIAMFAFRIRLPAFLYHTFDRLGELTTPLSMMVVGARIVGQSPKNALNPKVWALSALRLLVFPMLTYWACFLFGAPRTVCLITAVLAGMPHAALTAMQAEQYKLDIVFASNCVALSSLLSMATIPLLCVLLKIQPPV